MGYPKTGNLSPKLIEVRVSLSPEKKGHSAQWRLVEVKKND